MSTHASDVRVGEPGREGLGGAERWCIRQALRALGEPAYSLVAWTGEEFAPRGGPPQGRLHLRERPRLRDLAQGPDGIFADAYFEGRVEVEGDLARVIEAAFRAAERSPRWVRAAAALAGLRPRLATHRSARRNIHRHYDLGNDFYALWLDERMVYTCAYFPTPAASLEEAQLAKLEHVCRKLRLRAGERVIEAGCGWGALALHMAEALAAIDVENLRRHYARTLEHWLERFEKAAPRVRSMQGARFERTWRLYLASSLAAFRSGSCQLYQILFARQDDERLPWTCEWMHGRADAGRAVA